MTSLQLAQQIARRTPSKTLTAMPVEDLNALATAINQGLQEWYDKANSTHTSTPIGADINGSITIQGTATNGSKTIVLTSPPAWVATDGIGSSLVVGGDTRWNRLLSLTSLLFPYSGPTGAVTFTLWHDVVPLSDTLVSVGHPVRLIRSAGVFNERVLANGHVPPCWQWQGHTRWQGDPVYYDVEPLSTGEHSSPFFVMRVWPVPTRQVTLSFNLVKQWSITLSALSAPVDLPLPEDVASGIILPLALDHAAAADLLKKDTDFKRIAMDAASARTRIGQRTMHVITEPLPMGTPPGF
jgi:hypothetical protein